MEPYATSSEEYIATILANARRPPSLREFSYTLRHPEAWPEKFKWNFGICIQGPWGLALGLWYPELHSIICTYPPLDDLYPANILAILFGMARDDSQRIFFQENWAGVPANDVVAEMVADEIDKYLEGA